MCSIIVLLCLTCICFDALCCNGPIQRPASSVYSVLQTRQHVSKSKLKKCLQQPGSCNKTVANFKLPFCTVSLCSLTCPNKGNRFWQLSAHVNSTRKGNLTTGAYSSLSPSEPQTCSSSFLIINRVVVLNAVRLSGTSLSGLTPRVALCTVIFNTFWVSQTSSLFSRYISLISHRKGLLFLFDWYYILINAYPSFCTETRSFNMVANVTSCT